MTRQKAFKNQVRSRMSKTGERYTAARSRLLARSAPEPEAEDASQQAVPADMPVADAALRQATGRGWVEWLTVLDEWGAADRNHTQTARWLVEDQGVGGWWAQSVTVGYERARGLRAKHQTAGGFSVGANRTVAVSAARLFSAFTDPALREQWLGQVALRERTSRPGRSARFDWPANGSRLVVSFEEKGEAKSTVSVQHERLPDAASADEMKSFWRDRLSRLKAHMEALPE